MNVRRIATTLLVTERPPSEELPDNGGLLKFDLHRTSHIRDGIGSRSHRVEVSFGHVTRRGAGGRFPAVWRHHVLLQM